MTSYHCSLFEYRRGDRGSLGHGVQWDSPYIGNSKKENAVMALSNKCLSAYCQTGIFTDSNLVRKSYFFDLSFFPFFCNFYYASLFCGTGVI